MLPNGDHFYATYVFGTKYRNWLNITVAKPMTKDAEARLIHELNACKKCHDSAEVVEVVLGERESALGTRLGGVSAQMMKAA